MYEIARNNDKDDLTKRSFDNQNKSHLNIRKRDNKKKRKNK